MITEAEWSARRDETFARFHADQRAYHLAVHAAYVALDTVEVVSKARIVVLEVGATIEAEAAPTPVRKLAVSAYAAGWRWRIVRSLAAVPSKGPVEVVTLRFWRHDERGWASWHNGSFETAWFTGPHGLERLGGERMSTSAQADLAPIADLTVDQIKALAKAHSVKIPSKAKKIDMVAILSAAGVTSAKPKARTRGVLDAIEGIQLTRQEVNAGTAGEVRS